LKHGISVECLDIIAIKNPLDGDVVDSSSSVLKKAKFSSSTGTKVVYMVLSLMSI